jgi:DNA polymerase I-like protein with 3'-5' exonuclease and polymerase domains
VLADFETETIESRPRYPPRPVSLALKWPDRRDWLLMAWGHPTGNNCTEKEARGEYLKARRSRYAMCFQNAMFDTDVAETWWEVPLPGWDEYHDTMFLLFLWDPHSPTLALKPCAERYLGMKPEEQDRMNEWILANVLEARRKPSTAGAYISRCPYQIVKPYHKGDLVRTGGLFNYLYPRVVDAGMAEAYDRERRLMPILLRNARRGMRVDVDRLSQNVPKMKAGIARADQWLRKRLGVENLDSDRQLGEALYSKGIVVDFARTRTGQLSVSKKNLTVSKFKDKKVYHVLMYRSQMSTCVDMFGEPWLEKARGTGSLYPSWSQVRSPRGSHDASGGARTGRLICSDPNFLNIPCEWKRSMSAGYVHPAWLDVPELPYMRRYCLPDEKSIWGKRDYDSQELKIFGHFEEGPVMRGFLADPDYDIHELVRAEAERSLRAAGLRETFDRVTAKGVVFGRLYGQGVTGLMKTLNLPEEERPVAVTIQRAVNTALPSIKALDDELKNLANQDRPILTWGGRLYYCEPSSYSENLGRDVSYEYRLLNYLIQGSAADCTKEAIIRYNDHPKRHGRFVVSVYDEIDISVPNSKTAIKEEMTLLRDVMGSIEFDVPMTSGGEIGPSWGDLKDYEI